MNREFSCKLVALLGAIAALAGLAACGSPGEGKRGPVVLVPASLQQALEDVAAAWEAQGHARPVLSVAGTSSLARQAEAGAPADLFLSADAQWMDYLEQRDLLREGTRTDLLANRLVLVGAPHVDRLWLPPQPLEEAVGDAEIAVADAQAVPAGRYARAALKALGEWEALRDELIPAENVRAALALVERGQVPFGIVYATDQLASSSTRLVGSFPEGSTPPITYPAAVLAGSDHPQAAAFVDFLSGEEATAIFCAHGFTMPAGRQAC